MTTATVGLVWYRRADYARVLDMMADAAELPETFDAWKRQAEEARRHAGNLAHALKTPLTVIMNEATAGSADLVATVVREATTMRRQVDHHLARARAVGRRGSAQSRSEVWPSLKAVERAVSRLHRHVTIDLDAFALWCVLKGLERNGPARSRYVSAPAHRPPTP